MQRVGWIDFLRGISMILILVFHTEIYYKEYDVTPYYIYTTNAVVLFYFISGYLYYRQGITTLIAIPKALIRQEPVDWINIALHILSGRASWFIAALIVGELIFGALLVKTRGKTLWLSIDVASCFIIYFIIPFNQHNYWQWQDALLTVTFMYSGYVFNQYKERFNTINRPLLSLFLLLALIFIKVYEYDVDLPMRNIAIENVPLFLADSIVWLLLVTTLIKYIPRIRMIEWTGQHCIVYYFLAGGCPLIVSMIFNRIGFAYEGYLYRYILATLFVYLMATGVTWLIYKYVPFITGKKI